MDFTRRLTEHLQALGGGTVCELGGGARPALAPEFLHQHGLECLVVDLSAEELDKAPDGYRTLVGDASSPAFRVGEHEGQYDVVFSRALAEHVTDGRQFHANVHRLVRPGGVAMHFFPTLWWPPFVVNRVLPEAVAERLLLRLMPWRIASGTRAKFPAYYHWCYGPTPRQVRRFADVDFEVELCVAYFGAPSHAPGRLLKQVDRAWTRSMLRRPNYHLTSHATYVLRAR